MPAPNRPNIDLTNLDAAQKARITQYINWANQAENIVNTAEQRVQQHLAQIVEHQVNADQLSAQINTLNGTVVALQAIITARDITIEAARQADIQLKAERDALLRELEVLREEAAKAVPTDASGATSPPSGVVAVAQP